LGAGRTAYSLGKRAELTASVHREAERLLLSSALVPLRSLDALHVALAATSDVRAILTFDRNLARAAASCGILSAPALSAGG
jgi:predicted nucleic acid-binding protein